MNSEASPNLVDAHVHPARCGPENLAPCVDHVLECFGFDRVIFASDWPVCTLAATHAEWTRTLGAILAGAKAADLQKLHQSNAERIYRV